MTDKDYRIIINLLEKDILNNDIESLKKIRAYVTEQINICEKRTEPHNYDILTMEIRNFLDEYVDKNQRFRKGPLYVGIRRILKKETDENIIVADVLGIGIHTLKKEKGIGEYTINMFEKLLYDLGYSLDQELTTDQVHSVREKQNQTINIKKLLKSKKEDTNRL